MMRTKIKYNMRLFVPAVMIFFIAGIALSEAAPTVQKVFEVLTHAVQQDDNDVYRTARSVALELDERQFDALLDMFEKAGTWQALAMQGGLRIRRENPDLAADFGPSRGQTESAD